ncbi:small redox-active disulfide protein 2 [Peptoclostridium litorale DSM 5388]|uniref:Thioredoxin-like fold domain-containing protein n=1 Tax=Peptoclostridium litorale DSM 5388 TaxID=1121324 RepID=A0A069RC04_PEPLI|nr:thioredoxin family protein [Peptoclostridium litorale]KDR93785.1 hypothetical protein CLIT_23c00570 [Peptoclostridium litorale DSM 5388]SIN85813.1 small redox-active disulfide protein 2 [Peptoclostridium litorale DSM 5388]
MEIKILGTGCDKCNKLEANAKKAVEELGIEADVIKIDDLVEIMQHGVLNPPALVIDGEVKVAGKSVDVKTIKKYITSK